MLTPVRKTSCGVLPPHRPLPGWVPDRSWLDIVFLLLAAALIIRFFRTGGLAMLRMMGGSPDSHEHDHMDAQASD